MNKEAIESLKNQVEKVKGELLELLHKRKVWFKENVTIEIDTQILTDWYKVLGGKEEDYLDYDLSKVKNKIENYLFYNVIINPVRVQYIYQEIPKNHLLTNEVKTEDIKFRYHVLEKDGHYVITIQIL